MKKYTIIENIKKYKEVPVNQSWPEKGEEKLKSFMVDNPVRNNMFERRSRQEVVFKHLIFKPMPIAIIAIIASLITGSGMVVASQNSLPTDTLYPVKLIAEKVEEVVTFNDVKKVELQTKLADKRLGEIKDLQTQGKATKAVVEKNLQEYQGNLAKAQVYLNDINVNVNSAPAKIVAVSTKLEDAVGSQQVLMKTIEEKAPSEYKASLTEGRIIALNNSGQSREKIKSIFDANESPASNSGGADEGNGITSEGKEVISISPEGVDSQTVPDNSGQADPIKIINGEKEIISEPIASNGRIISKESAIKIAFEAGLAKGIDEWRAELNWQAGKINNYVWSVSNSLSKYNGQTVLINASNGKVYQILDYQIANVSPISVPKPVPTPRPVPTPLPKPIDCPEYIDCMPKIVEPGEKATPCQIPVGCEGITEIAY